jgi:hypothetical protein
VALVAQHTHTGNYKSQHDEKIKKKIQGEKQAPNKFSYRAGGPARPSKKKPKIKIWGSRKRNPKKVENRRNRTKFMERDNEIG